MQDLTAPSKLVKTNFPSLDRLIGKGLQRGKCSAIFGPAGNAKSMFVLNMMIRMIQDNVREGDCGGYMYESDNPLYIPLEYTRTDHARRALGVIINSWGITSEDPKQKKMSVDWIRGDSFATNWIEGLSNHIAHNPTTATRASDGTLEIPVADYTKMLKLIDQEAHRRDLIIIDPLTAIYPDDAAKKSQYEQQAEFLRSCNAIAMESDTHIMFVTHSGRRQKHNGKEQALTMDNIAGSMNITRFVQYILILDYHRGEKKKGNVFLKGGGTKEVEYTRTLKLDKLNAGCGTGANLAVDFVGGPQMDVFGMLEN